MVLVQIITRFHSTQVKPFVLLRFRSRVSMGASARSLDSHVGASQTCNHEPFCHVSLALYSASHAPQGVDERLRTQPGFHAGTGFLAHSTNFYNNPHAPLHSRACQVIS